MFIINGIFLLTFHHFVTIRSATSLKLLHVSYFTGLVSLSDHDHMKSSSRVDKVYRKSSLKCI